MDNGSVIVYFPLEASAGTCGNKNLGVIKYNNGIESSLYSLVLAAHAAGKKVEVYGSAECDYDGSFRVIGTVITER